MGHFKKTMYYGPNCEDWSDKSPEGKDERGEIKEALSIVNPVHTPYRLFYAVNGEKRTAYFAGPEECHKAMKQHKDAGRLVYKQFWSEAEGMWIG